MLSRLGKMGWRMVFFSLVFLVLALKLVTIESPEIDGLAGAYSVAVSAYIISRFMLAYLNTPMPVSAAQDEPSFAVVVPCKDEEDHIRQSILRLRSLDYPPARLEVVVVNDGSTDGSLEQIRSAASELAASGISVQVVDWRQNRGKREAMAEGIRLSSAEFVLMVDSDSFVEPDCLRHFVAEFEDPRVAAVSGHADVENCNVNALTRMQNVKYYVAFRVFKAAESLFGAVVCCSGCCSAYRRSALLEVLDQWLVQTFLGVRCTFGDDRSLTNELLRTGYRTKYSPNARARTIVPEAWPLFLRQQLRWKKSWVRESILASRFMWRKRHPIAVVSFYVGVLLPLLAPVMVLRALLLVPMGTGMPPVHYLLGLLLMAAVFGVFYQVERGGTHWVHGVAFAGVSTVLLVWQLPWAVLRVRDSQWGTR